MAIVSTGYEGSVDYADWAVLTSHLGAQYSVFGVDAFAISAGPGDRQLIIGPGEASGQGILDVSAEPLSVAGAAVGSGSRWDMVVLRRTWGSNETLPFLITGSPAKALPARQNTPGVVDDQPLYLVRFTAGQSAVQEIIDLRVWHGDGGLIARDRMVLDYLNRIGTSVMIQGFQWIRDISPDGLPRWSVKDPTLTFQRVGSDIPSIAVPSGAGSGPLITKSGQMFAATIVQFGNEYFPGITFATPFPNACTHVSLTALSNSPITRAVGDLAIDSLNASSFRVLVPGSANPWYRGFLWQAVGY